MPVVEQTKKEGKPNMKKSNFAALILGTISGVFFALGMCMALLPEWGMRNQGIISGVIGLVLMLVTVGVWRKMEGKAPIRISGKTIGATLIGVIGALLLGVGMCLCMVFGKMMLGIVIGIIGIVILLMLIPLLKGLHD